jgi:hypothetical protein
MRTATRIDYDTIAHLYDAQPYRGKAVDPALLSFLERRTERGPPSILDVACGTGSQLVENRSIAAGASGKSAALNMP